VFLMGQPRPHFMGAGPQRPTKLAARDLFAVANLFVTRYFCVFQDELSQQLEIYSWFIQVGRYFSGVCTVRDPGNTFPTIA